VSDVDQRRLRTRHLRKAVGVVDYVPANFESYLKN